ncbi:MAG: GtrA family protein [Neisseriaceae bacterium]|nr:GtrA family protein [Neisseriaceae bacterium]
MLNRILNFQVARFVIVGVAATLTDLWVAWLIWRFFGLHETACAVIGFAVAFWVSFFGHRFFTFQKTGNPLKFLALAVSMLALREVMIYGLTLVGVRGFMALFIPLCTVTLITFFISKYQIFKR